MEFKAKKKLIDQLSLIEERYAVETWNLNHIQYWPILKNIIYFRDRKITKNSIIRGLFNSPIITIKKVVTKLIDKKKNKRFLVNQSVDFDNISKCDVIFSGSKVYFQYMENYYLNRYFDPIMDNIEDKYSSMLFDYSISPEDNVYKRERVISLSAFYNSNLRNKSLEIFLDSKFTAEIKQVSKITKISESVLVRELVQTIKEITVWKLIWKKILQKTEAKVAFVLCYYNEPMYGLLLAAKERGVPTVDMQHGGQGDLHPAYSFKNFPNCGFNSLPSIFWVWNKSSSNHILNWLNTPVHSVSVAGNPWIDFLKKSKITLQTDDKKIIICTLTIGLSSIFPAYLLNSIIESSNEYSWWLRFHPRTNADDKKSLHKILKKHNLYEKVEITKSNELPLPLLLLNGWAHISHSSGSLSEAAILGLKRNIVTSELGAQNHIELLKESKVFYYNPDTETKNLIEFAESLPFPSVKGDEEIFVLENYKVKIDEIINNIK